MNVRRWLGGWGHTKSSNVGLLPTVLTVLLAGGLGPLHAQDSGGVEGVVWDRATRQPVSAAEVSIPGTNLVAITGERGVFQIEDVPTGMVEVQVRRLGYASERTTVEVPVGQSVRLDFQLFVSAVALDELVITATGSQRRRELGNATTVIQVPWELERAAPIHLTSLIQGRATGVQVLQNSGSVGTAWTLRMRGNSSIGLGNTPLVYVDGARLSNDTHSGPNVGGQSTSRWNDLALEDIESIEIVRGPSAATLYGTEAAAGVIRITTRRGEPGSTEWTFRSELGSNWDATAWPVSVWNPSRAFGDVLDLAQVFPGQIPPGTFTAEIPDSLYAMTLLRGDAGDGDVAAPWRTALEQAYGLSLRGGTEDIRYFLSTDLAHRQGSLDNNETSRRSMRGNLEVRPSDQVELFFSTAFASASTALPYNDISLNGAVGVGLLSNPRQMPIQRSDLVTGQATWTCPMAYELQRASVEAGFDMVTLDDLGAQCGSGPFLAGRNFEAISDLDNHQKVERFTGSTTLQYRPFDFLTGTGTVGYDQFSDQTRQFFPVNPDLPFGSFSQGHRSVHNTVHRNFTLEGSVTATFDLGSDIRAATSVGGQFFRDHREEAGSIGRILPAGTRSVSNALQTEGMESISEVRTLGLFVEQQIGFRDRIFVTPAVRFDRNSAFGGNLGTKAYPRIMASWVLGEEEWFPGVFESFRVRGAWGQAGRQPSSFSALRLMGVRRVAFRGQDLVGVTFTQPGNPDLRPETGTEVEVGFEAQLLDGRLGLDVTWFRQTVDDAIVAGQVAPSTGFSDPTDMNIGRLKNSGVEVGVSGVAVNRPAFRWDWRVNLSTVKGRITRLDDPILFGIDGVAQRHQEGYPFGAYFSRGYYVNELGEVESTDESVYQGHPTPEYEGAVLMGVTLLSRLTLSAHVGFAGGHQQFNSTQEFRCGFQGGVCPEIFETDGDGALTDAARIKRAASRDIQFGPWMEDADFVRLRGVSARLEFPSRWIQGIGASRASFTLAAENLGLWTRYSGLDPEVNYAGSWERGDRTEFLTLPPGRRVNGRLSITF